MPVAGDVYCRAGAGCDGAGGAAGGVDQALHSLEQVSYIVEISTHAGYILRYVYVKIFLNIRYFVF